MRVYVRVGVNSTVFFSLNIIVATHFTLVLFNLISYSRRGSRECDQSNSIVFTRPLINNVSNTELAVFRYAVFDSICVRSISEFFKNIKLLIHNFLDFSISIHYLFSDMNSLSSI